MDKGGFKLSQPLLKKQILRTLGFNERTKPKDTPAVSSKILHNDVNSPQFETKWDSRGVLGQFIFLKNHGVWQIIQCTTGFKWGDNQCAAPRLELKMDAMDSDKIMNANAQGECMNAMEGWTKVSAAQMEDSEECLDETRDSNQDK